MKLLYPLTILRTGDKIKLLAAVAVVADGTDAQVVRVTGEDGDVSIAEAARIVMCLIDNLRGLEIDVPDQMQVEAFKLAGMPDLWRTT